MAWGSLWRGCGRGHGKLRDPMCGTGCLPSAPVSRMIELKSWAKWSGSWRSLCEGIRPPVLPLGVFLLCCLVLAGCSTFRRQSGQAKPGTEGVGELAPPGQIVEGSTLDRYKKGLPPEEGGSLKDVHFAFDSYELNQESRDVLVANAEWLKDSLSVAVEIEGHCDERGTLEYNLALGAKRARTVKEYLASMGIAPERLSTISYGEELPLCRERTEACWTRNRRAHFVLISK